MLVAIKARPRPARTNCSAVRAILNQGLVKRPSQERSRRDIDTDTFTVGLCDHSFLQHKFYCPQPPKFCPGSCNSYASSEKNLFHRLDISESECDYFMF